MMNACLKGPYRTSVVAGQVYRWCSCGLSDKQPFCDEAHRGTRALPVLHRASQTMVVAMCGCKHTKTPPYCDGAHIYFDAVNKP